MNEVDFTKTAKCPWDIKKIINIVKIAAKAESKLKGGIEINIVGDKRIRTLNRVYRGIDKQTDVLSFAWQEEKKFVGNFLGQIYISYPQIKRQAKKYEVSTKEEFRRILIHGLLHLVGYDHVVKKEAKTMFGLQEKLLKKIKN